MNEFRNFARTVTLVAVLLFAGCGSDGGGGGSGTGAWSTGTTGGAAVEAGTSGYGAGPGASGTTDLRGTYAIGEHDVQSENCTDLTSESDYLAGKVMTLTLMQEGATLHGIFRSAVEGDDAQEPIELFGTATGTNFSLSGRKSASDNQTQDGVSMKIDITVDMRSEGQVTGDAIQGNFSMDVSGSVKASFQGQSMSEDIGCSIQTTWSGNRTAQPSGGIVGTPDAGATDAGVLPVADAGPATDAGMASRAGSLTAAPPTCAVRDFRLHGIRLPLLRHR